MGCKKIQNWWKNFIGPKQAMDLLMLVTKFIRIITGLFIGHCSFFWSREKKSTRHRGGIRFLPTKTCLTEIYQNSGNTNVTIFSLRTCFPFCDLSLESTVTLHWPFRPLDFFLLSHDDTYVSSKCISFFLTLPETNVKSNFTLIRNHTNKWHETVIATLL